MPETQFTDGIYYNFRRGKEVEFFVLDGRSHRIGTDPEKENKHMFGVDQLDWLCDRLNQSEAKFKVIIAGSAVDSGKGQWNKFSDKEKIKNIFNGKRFTENTKSPKKIDGVIIVTGDIHKCDLVEHGYDFEAPYTIYEVISSGIAIPIHYDEENEKYVPRPQGFAFATLTFRPGEVRIDFHRQNDAFSKYKDWLRGLSDDELNNSILLGHFDSGRLDKLKAVRKEWLDLSEMSDPPNSRTVHASDLINAISVQAIAKKYHVSGSFRVLSNLLEKDSTQSLYHELYLKKYQ